MAANEQSTFYRTRAAGISIRENPGLFQLGNEANWGDQLANLVSNPLVMNFTKLNTHLYKTLQRDPANFLADENHEGIYVMKQRSGRGEQLAAIGTFLGAFDIQDFRRKEAVGWGYSSLDRNEMHFYRNYPALNGVRLRQVNLEYDRGEGMLNKIKMIDTMSVNRDIGTRVVTVVLDNDGIFKIEDRREIVHNNLVGKAHTAGIVYALRTGERQPFVQEFIDREAERAYPGSRIGWQDNPYFTAAQTAATGDNKVKWLAENLPYDEAVFAPLISQNNPI